MELNDQISPAAWARKLERLRTDPAYFAGELVDTAADVAQHVYRPPRRQSTIRGAGRLASEVAIQRPGPVDYDAINQRYQRELQGAPGWEVGEPRSSAEQGTVV
jgi:hypothetical protein